MTDIQESVKYLKSFYCHVDIVFETNLKAILNELERLQNNTDGIELTSKKYLADKCMKLEEENKRYREALKEMVFAYENKDEDMPHQFEIEAMKTAKQALEE